MAMSGELLLLTILLGCFSVYLIAVFGTWAYNVAEEARKDWQEHYNEAKKKVKK